MAVQQLQHTHGTTVVPSDTLYLFQSLGYPYRVSSALFVGVGGSVRVLTEGGDDVVFSSVPDGTFMPVHVVKVFATGTTASSIVAVDLSNLFPYLLDAYSGAAAAYSLRQLSSSYSGSAIRVRRASDNTEQDIGFSNKELDTTTLASFCSGTNGFITTWYDQSGNARNVTQTTAANQPKIYDSSTGVITENGKAAVQFDGSNDVLQKTSFGFPTTNISIVKVGARIGAAAHDSIGYSQTPPGGLININGNTRIGFDGRPSGSSYVLSTATTTATTSQILQFNIYDGYNLKASVDGGAFSSTAVSANPIIYGTNDLQIGAITNITQYYNCNNSEFIMWGTDQSGNKSGIETNINGFYSIY